MFVQKICTFNVDEIDTSPIGVFYEHVLFEWPLSAKLFGNCVSANLIQCEKPNIDK